MIKKLSYHQSVNYSQADPMKVLAQKEGLSTTTHMPFGFQELTGTRGESAYVFQMGEQWGALVQEGLGTKSLVAQTVYGSSGRSFFHAIAQDSVACIINDLVSVGATPVVLNAYWSSSSYDWLASEELARDFITGWRAACDQAQVVWGGGETQSLPGIVEKNTLEIAGSAFGIIQSAQNLVQASKLRSGDTIVLVESSGIHANGVSLVRQLAEKLPDGYATKLKNGQTLGEAILTPTHIYARLVAALQTAKIDLHYLSNITGHGWRKIMRAERDFTYTITTIPPVPEIFIFTQEKSVNSTEEMYSTFNMGAGYAIFVSQDEASHVVDIARKCNLQAWVAGTISSGSKQLIIKPLDLTFAGSSLGVR
jgi:phosphoribosylformylglycinamidine cyclo-ligase